MIAQNVFASMYAHGCPLLIKLLVFHLQIGLLWPFNVNKIYLSIYYIYINLTTYVQGYLFAHVWDFHNSLIWPR